MECSLTSLVSMELLVYGGSKPLRTVVAGWNEQPLRTWILLFVLISVAGSSYIWMMSRFAIYYLFESFFTHERLDCIMVFYVSLSLQCLCELPESYEAYKKQQYRWHSGPMQLFRLCFMDIIRSKVWKFHLILMFPAVYYSAKPNKYNLNQITIKMFLAIFQSRKP